MSASLDRSALRGAVASLALATILGAHCTKSAPGGSPPAENRDAAPRRQALAARPAAPPSWVQAVRWSSWPEAARTLDALDPKTKSVPDIAYVRARVALSLGRHAEAARLLEGLEIRLPQLESDIVRQRAESQLVAGPFDRAAKYFAAQGTTDGFIKAATAFFRLGDLGKARSAVDRALALCAVPGKAAAATDEQARARAIRAQILERQGHAALAATDLRWLALRAVTHPDAADAASELGRLSPTHKLTARERYDRAMAMADQGWVERVESELTLALEARGPRPTEAELLRARGLARSAARTDLEEAGKALERAAQLDPGQRVRDLFRAARTWSRASEDARALRIYDELARRYSGSSSAEQARFLGARLHLIAGRWPEAIAAFSAYQTRYGRKGPHTKSAAYFRAVAGLASGRFAEAGKAFSALVKDEDSDRLKARYLELYGAALEGQKEFEQADSILRRVIQDYPLSFPALAAAARLKARSVSLESPTSPGMIGPPAPPLVPELPPKARFLMTLGLDADAEAALVEHEVSIKQSYPRRALEALCTAYGRLEIARRRYQIGQSAAGLVSLGTSPTPRDRWLWECLYPRPYAALAASVERQYDLPSELIYAIMRQESAFVPDARSPAQALGLMQIIPSTARQLADQMGIGCTPDQLSSPACSLPMGGAYVKQLLDMFGGLIPLAAAAYNAGPHAVSRWLETGEQLPLDVFVARIPYDETRGYVTYVVGNWARYRALSGGPEVEIALELPRGLRAPGHAF